MSLIGRLVRRGKLTVGAYLQHYATSDGFPRSAGLRGKGEGEHTEGNVVVSARYKADGQLHHYKYEVDLRSMHVSTVPRLRCKNSGADPFSAFVLSQSRLVSLAISLCHAFLKSS